MQANEGKAKQGVASNGKAKAYYEEFQEDCRERVQERAWRTAPRAIFRGVGATAPAMVPTISGRHPGPTQRLDKPGHPEPALLGPMSLTP